MSKEIKDYLHLYLNSVDVIIDTVRDDFKAHFGHAPGHKTQLGPMLYAVILEGGVTVKPILRDLSDMTEEEKLHLYGMGFTHNSKGLQIEHPQKWPTFKPLQFLYLLSKGFDLFGLIPAGLAINAKDLKQ